MIQENRLTEGDKISYIVLSSIIVIGFIAMMIDFYY